MSKAQRVLGFLRENRDGAFFSKDVVEALAEHGVKTRDVMANVRRYERRGLVYVRGYKTDETETPPDPDEWYRLSNHQVKVDQFIGGRPQPPQPLKLTHVEPPSQGWGEIPRKPLNELLPLALKAQNEDP